MSKFFDDTMQGLLEALEIEKGNVPLKEKKDMSGKTYYVADSDKKLIDKVIQLRKTEKISQKELANLLGTTQQSVSRFEKNDHSSSVKFLANIVDALGYDVQFVKKENA